MNLKLKVSHKEVVMCDWWNEMEIRNSSHFFSLVKSWAEYFYGWDSCLTDILWVVSFLQMEQRWISYCKQMFKIKSGYFWVSLPEFYFFQNLYAMSCVEALKKLNSNLPLPYFITVWGSKYGMQSQNAQ